MNLGRNFAIAALWLIVLPLAARGQHQPPSDYLLINASRAFTWTDGSTNIVQLHGPLTIQTDRATLSADRAVIWLTPLPGTVLDQRMAQVALIGNAKLVQQQVERTGDTLLVSTQVRGSIRITADQRLAQNQSDGDLYRQALQVRAPAQEAAVQPQRPQPPPRWAEQQPWTPAAPSEQPPPAPPRQGQLPAERIDFKSGAADTTTTPDGKLAAVLSNGVTIVMIPRSGDIYQLQADRVVVFTPLDSLEQVAAVDRLQQVEAAMTAVYLEGDVRIIYTPAGRGRTEQQLRAKRAYFDATTERAVLTDAIIHTTEPTTQIPLVVRAHTVRQLSSGEFRADGAKLSTSTFATPSYSINSDRAYIRQYDTGDPRLGQRTIFDARNNTFQVHNLPLFWWPWAAGSITDRGFPLRELQFDSSRGFGPAVKTRWGLFESIGQPPPADLDASVRLDYFGDRGPAGGFDADYRGGYVTETGKQPWNFQGDFTSYFVNDHGEDRLARDRARVTPDDDFRYHALWEHQHFFPEDWQLQLRGGIVSDETFLEEWFTNDYNNGLPHELSAYLKRQRQTEAITFLGTIQPNDFVTISDSLQEGTEIERLPEIGYYRIGDSFGDDQFTFFSANTISGLQFSDDDALTAEELADHGFRAGQTPGLPSYGYTGVDDDLVWRGDFRQEVDYPITLGQFRTVPYVFARYTPYSDSPEDDQEHRVFVGTGVRLTTAFWKVDDSARSDLLDIHRVRHVIEPEINFFTSASTTEREDVFVYDEDVDAVNDITALQIAVRQRWQTKRGGPGRWRSVDFFTLNTEANFFANQPDDDFLEPEGFRGLFFSSLPEASIPRNSINADALWRVSDSTALLGDIQYNLDEFDLATTSIGLAAQRDSRLSYFLGLRYIGEITSTIASAAANYELSAKYSLRLQQSFDFSERENQNTSITVIRRFDRYFVTVTTYYDAIEDESGFRIGVFPEGLGYGLSSDQFQSVFGAQ